MHEITGWLIDLYAAPEGGIKLWIICKNGELLCLRKNFAVTIYAGGDFSVLRRAWIYLHDKNVSLARTRRSDLFTGERDVLAITVPHPHELPRLFRDLAHEFPMLDYYDADIPLPLRFATQTDVRLLSYCRFMLDGELVCAIEALDSPWALDPCLIPLRVLSLSLNIEPALGTPSKLMVKYESDGVSAWGARDVERKMVDIKQYLRLLKRAEAEVFDVFGESTQNASFAFRRVQA